MSRRPQLMFPQARHWPRQPGPPYPGWYAREKWMVWKGYAATEAEAAVMVSGLIANLLFRPAADAQSETRRLNTLDQFFDADPVMMNLLCGIPR